MFSVSLGCALLSILALELLLGALMPTRVEAFAFESDFPTLASDRLLVEHPKRFYALARSFRYSAEHGGRYANGDDWPFRGRPPEPAPPGVKRVGVFGDSCIFGTGLDPRDTLPFQTQMALVPHGWDPELVQVLNFGVPGYSSVQIGLLLEERLGIGLDVVVLYTAAWNDQAAAMGANDIELRERGASGLARALRETAIFRALEHSLGRAVEAGARASADEIRSAWEAGSPLYGTRVPEGQLTAEFERILDLCERHGARVIVVAPAHPEETARAYPRTRRDAKVLLDIARERGLDAIDTQEHLEQRNVTQPLHFIDFVHLAPEAMLSLAEPLADLVSRALGPNPSKRRSDASLLPSVRPERASALGDVPLEVQLDFDAEDPTILVGGARLLALKRTGERTWSGLLSANRAGMSDLLVQSSQGIRWKPAAIELVAPSVELQSDGPEPLLCLTSRPGDRAVIFLAEGDTPSPKATPQGRYQLEGYELLPYELEVVCGDDGFGSTALPAEARGFKGTLLAQPLVAPHGVPADNSVARWGAISVLDFGND